MDNHQFLNQVHQLIWNEKQLAAMDTYFAPNVVSNNPFGKAFGLQALRQDVQTWLDFFPDLHNVDEEIIATRDTIVVKWESTGTHTTAFMGVPPTGRKIRYNGVSVVSLLDGKIIDYYANANLFAILQQIGGVERVQLIPLTQQQNASLLLNELRKFGTDKGKMALSPREIECLSLYLNGKTAKHIANIICVSHRTVQAHIRNIMTKLNCSSKPELFDLINEYEAMHLFNLYSRLLCQQAALQAA